MTKVRTYRIDVDDSAQVGDAIVISTNGSMTSQHLWSAASAEIGTCAGNVPVLDVNWELPASAVPSSVMKKNIYDPNNKGVDVYNYCNFDNTPEIPVVYNPQVTFTQWWVTIWTISLNQSWDSVIDFMSGGVTPGKAINIDNNQISVNFDETSLLLDDNWKLSVNGYNSIVEWASAWSTAVQPWDLCAVATTWQYSDLSWTPLLCAVATSARYCDLIDTPTIPSVIDSLTSSCTNEALSAKQGCILNTCITNINWKIPSAATTSNQLADKAFVNSSINAVAAYYITKDIQWDQFATKAELDAATVYYSGWQVRVPTRNDYTIVASDETHDNATTRYLYNNDWEYQYTINETPLTQAQLNALNSWITSNKVSCYDDIVTSVNWYWDIVTHNASEFAQVSSLATVATSGKYCDLSGLPTIPTAVSQLSNDCNYTSCLGTVVADDLLPYARSETLCTVATSGKYCDLTGLPTIPAALTSGNGISISSNKINAVCDNSTIKVNSWNCLYADFTWLATTEELACKADTSSLCTVATSGQYCDLSWLPTIPTNNNQLTNWCGYTTCTWTVVASDLNPYAKSCDLSSVATSGQYCDLSWLPTIPTDNCQLANWCNYVTGACVNVKKFTLSNASDLVTAQAAYDWYLAWNTPILVSGAYTYILEWTGSSYVRFVSTNQNWWTQWNSRTTVATSAITLCKSSNTINCIATSSVYSYNFLETDRNYSTPYTPQYDWSPATKKYVDDCIWSINSAEWGCITWTLSSQTDLQWALDCRAKCCDMVCTLDWADNLHYPSAKAVSDAISSSGWGDMSKSTYDPNNINADAFNYCNFINTPTIPTNNNQLANGCGYITDAALSGYAKTCDIPTDNCQLSNWCWYVTSASLDTRTFKLTNTSDTTNATAALTYINWWGNAIILYNNVVYTLTSKSSTQLVFKWPSTITAWTSYTTINQPTLTFTVSWTSVTAITSANASLWKYLEADRNYTTPITPTYNGSPATKKYVDDCVWSINSAEWWCITGTLSNQTDLNNALACKAQCCDIPTDNCQLANSCWYTTCTGTLSATNVWTNWQVLTQTSSWPTWCDVEWWGWDMQYCDFNFVTKTWASVSLDLNSEITPSSDFTVNVPSEIKNWQAYVLRVNSWATPYTMTLGSCINNPNDMDLTLTANWTDQFVFFAINDNELDLQMSAENEIVYVTQAEYNALPASKNTDGKSYFIYE